MRRWRRPPLSGLARRPASASAATRSTAPTLSTRWNVPRGRRDPGHHHDRRNRRHRRGRRRRLLKSRAQEADRRLHRRRHRAAGPADGPCRRDHRRRQGRHRRQDGSDAQRGSGLQSRPPRSGRRWGRAKRLNASSLHDGQPMTNFHSSSRATIQLHTNDGCTGVVASATPRFSDG